MSAIRRHRSPALLTAALGIAVASPARAEDTVRLIVRAFIPKSHPTQPAAIKPVPGNAGLFMLSDALPTGLCFDTDHREFSENPSASARVATDITLILSDPVQVKPSAGASAHKTGETVRRNCTDGKNEKRATAPTSGCHIGAPAAAGKRVQVVLGCSAGNPLVPGAPKIDYSGTVTYEKDAKTLAFEATVGTFPAFEAYASLNGKPFKKIFAVGPAPGTTPWALFDLGTGFQSRVLSKVAVKLD